MLSTCVLLPWDIFLLLEQCCLCFLFALYEALLELGAGLLLTHSCLFIGSVHVKIVLDRVKDSAFFLGFLRIEIDRDEMH